MGGPVLRFRPCRKLVDVLVHIPGDKAPWQALGRTETVGAEPDLNMN